MRSFPTSKILQLTPMSSTADRMSALRAFLQQWYGLTILESVPESGSEGLPALLVAAHRLLSRVPHAIVQNELLALDQLRPDAEGRLVFYVENQAVCHWATETTSADPPVWWRLNERGRPWRREEEPLSGFLIQLFLFEALLQAPVCAHAAEVSPTTWHQLRERMTPLPLGAWCWPEYPSLFYAREGAIALLCPIDSSDGPPSVFFAAKEWQELAFLRDLADQSWENPPREP